MVFDPDLSGEFIRFSVVSVILRKLFVSLDLLVLFYQEKSTLIKSSFTTFLEFTPMAIGDKKS
jgi:hypothetical protein